MSIQYEIKYHNKVLNVDNSFLTVSLEDAKTFISNLQNLFEIENIRLFKIKELSINKL